MLAMVVNDDAGHQTPHGVLRFIASRLAPTGLFQVTRCKSETIGGRYRRNGYVLSQQYPSRLSGRHREQARSHSRWCSNREKLVGYEAAIAIIPYHYRNS
jgi:hypothetical protein